MGIAGIKEIEIRALHVEDSVYFSGDLDLQAINVKQDFSVEWSKDKAYGKMDPISNFSSVARKFSIDMFVTIPSNAEVNLDLSASQDIYNRMAEKVDRLVQFQYPAYDSNGVIKSPPFFEIKLFSVDYTPNFQGYFDSFSVTPGHAEGYLTKHLYNRKLIREVGYAITFDFIVLHEFAPGWVGGEFQDGGKRGFTYTERTPKDTQGGELGVFESIYKEVFDVNIDLSEYVTNKRESNGN